MYPKKFSLSFIFLYLLCDISISISLCVALSTTLWNTHIVSVFLFFPPVCCFFFCFFYICVCVCVSMFACLCNLYYKFATKVHFDSWYNFLALRFHHSTRCLRCSRSRSRRRRRCFWQLLRSRSAVCEVGLSLSHSPPVCLSSPSPSQVPFQQPTAHFTSSAFGNMCAFRLSVCPFLFSFLSSLSCFY